MTSIIGNVLDRRNLTLFENPWSKTLTQNFYPTTILSNHLVNVFGYFNVSRKILLLIKALGFLSKKYKKF